MFKRELKIDLPRRQSAFLWGARQTGKSFFLKENFKNSIVYDLLNTHNLARFTASPDLLRQEVLQLTNEQLKYPIVVDEIQKVPQLLNEVHWLIENTQAQFILCGSSARKLKKTSVNLLGGRAWKYNFFPCIYKEIPNFNLLHALNQGLIPKHYLADAKDITNHLQAYVDIYLTEEIRNEGLVRNLPGFARFLDLVGMTNGEMINYSNIARDCAVSRLLVQEYYNILIDTLLGYFIYPYNKKVKRDIISTMPKFYLFDVGVANYLAQQKLIGLGGNIAGKCFEHFILMELFAFRSINKKRFSISYWRTKTGLEVDFILGKAEAALEVKISEQVHKEDLGGLIAFCEENPKAKPIVISRDLRPRKLEVNKKIHIDIVPWEIFLQKLWQNEIV